MDAGPPELRASSPRPSGATGERQSIKNADRQPFPGTPPNSLPRSVNFSLAVIATFCVAAAAIAAKAVLVPMLLAALLALALTPVTLALERLGIPSPAAAAISVVIASAAIAAVSLVALPKFAALAERLPSLIEAFNRKILPFTAGFREVGDATEALGALVGAGSGAADVQTVQIAGDSTIKMLLGLMPGVFAQFLFIVLLSIFILADKRKYRQKLIAMHATLHMRLRYARMFRDVGKKVSSYFFVITVLNVLDGAATAAVFYLLGLPDPILWGVAFGVANFVPIIGATSVILASAVVGVATQDNLLIALAGPAAMTAINAVEANIVQPLLLSRRMVVNPVALLISFALFTWMWGAAATVLSVPMVVCFAVIAKYTPGLRPLSVLLTNEKPVRGGLTRLKTDAGKLTSDGTFHHGFAFMRVSGAAAESPKRAGSSI